MSYVYMYIHVPCTIHVAVSPPPPLQEVICPVCAAHPSGDPNHLTDDLPTHLTVEHRALRDMEMISCVCVCMCVSVCVCV